MIRTSGIRDKLRSKVLKDLIEERSSKKLKLDDRKKTNDSETYNGSEDNGDPESIRADIERRMSKARNSNSELLNILPRPKNASSFGPTIRLDKLLKMQKEKTAEEENVQLRCESPVSRITEDGMIEVDVSREVSDVAPIVVKNLTIEESRPGAIVLPKGKEKQKNQITYLAQLGKANELEQKQKAAQGRANKVAARSKYGW